MTCSSRDLPTQALETLKTEPMLGLSGHVGDGRITVGDVTHTLSGGCLCCCVADGVRVRRWRLDVQ